MNKVLDLNKNVAQLCSEYPELKQIMADLGFTDILKPIVMNTMGRMMTIPKGSAMKEIPMDHIVDTLEQNGFQVIHISGEKEIETRLRDVTKGVLLNEKEILLKSYIRRLTEGENIAVVKEDFRKNFSDVSAVEIARAEQSLMKEGTPLGEVQRLCDVHSALFHGKTDAERIANAEKEVQRSANEEKMNQISAGFEADVAKKTKDYMQEAGHPLHVLTLENHAIIQLVEEIEKEFEKETKKEIGKKTEKKFENDIKVETDREDFEIAIDDVLLTKIKKLATIAQHYGKKDELIFPLLKDKYGYPGPSDVMWGVEDEIRDHLRQVMSNPKDTQAPVLLATALKRIHEMIYKEENILFPLVVSCFTESEWIAVARDMPMFGPCLIDMIPHWEKAMTEKKQIHVEDGNVNLPGGSMNLIQLQAVLNTLPMEITVIDENDINVFFNEGEKLFTRPTMAIGRKVYSCHPKRVEPMVRMLLHEFKTGKKDSMHILSEKCGKQVLIHYFALRDANQNYIGTLEAVQELDTLVDAIKSGKKGPIHI